MNNVTWKDIPNYEGIYCCSNLGEIKSNRKYKKLSLDKDGYLKVNLYNKNQTNKCFVHRIVALTFIPNPNNYPQVNHKNGIKYDNRVENLEWCTAKMNVQHAYETGLKIGKCGCHKGINNPNSKLTENEVIDILSKKQKGIKIRDVYEVYKNKISFSGMEQIWYRKKWKHLVEKVSD